MKFYARTKLYCRFAHLQNKCKAKNIARIIGAINEILEKTLTLFPDKLNTLTWTISMILLTC